MFKSISTSRSLIIASLMVVLGTGVSTVVSADTGTAWLAGPSVITAGQEVSYTGGNFLPGTNVEAMAADDRGARARVTIPVKSDGSLSSGFQADRAGTYTVTIVDGNGKILASTAINVIAASGQ